MRSGRIGVRSEAWGYHIAFGFDLASIPRCIAELESNCCRAPSGAIQRLFGDAVEDAPGSTFHDRALAYWNAAGGRFAWSRLADRFVPEPR